jgi:hypothetical protein
MRSLSLGLFSVVLFACGSAEPPAVDVPPDVEPVVDAPPVIEPIAATETVAKPSLNEGARVFFVSPTEGASVTSPVSISFGIEGAEVKPAGEDVPNSGHHHLIINGTGIEQGIPVPKDATHIHYGKGQTEASVELTPGTYTLTMQFANYLHQSYGEVGSTSIQVTVK